MQQSLVIKQEERHNMSSTPKKEQDLRRSYSDLVLKTEKILKELSVKNNNEIKRVECECCGMSEECTPMYIDRIRGFFCGRWVCGLCSEAVKEDMNQHPTIAMEQSLESHMALCKSFKTSRLNPQLSLASAMRDIARKSFKHRTTSDDHFFAAAAAASNVARTTSCCGARRPNVKFRRSSFQ